MERAYMSMSTVICPLAVTAMRRRPSPKVSGFPVRSAAGFAPNTISCCRPDCAWRLSIDCPIRRQPGDKQFIQPRASRCVSHHIVPDLAFRSAHARPPGVIRP